MSINGQLLLPDYYVILTGSSFSQLLKSVFSWTWFGNTGEKTSLKALQYASGSVANPTVLLHHVDNEVRIHLRSCLRGFSTMTPYDLFDSHLCDTSMLL